MAKPTYLTRQGVEQLRNELAELKNVRRPAILARIREAQDFGDLAENEEYHYAKQEQGFIEGRISEIEHILKTAKVIEGAAGDVVTLGSQVKVKLNGDSADYTIVGTGEADPATGKISADSPLGQALLGHKKGEKVEVATPRGVAKYTILEIS